MIKVLKIADVINNHVVHTPQNNFTAGDLAVILTNAAPIADPAPDGGWTMELTIGEGPGARNVIIDLVPLLGRNTPKDKPIVIIDRTSPVFYFKEMLFIAERGPLNAEEHEEISLRIRKVYFQQQDELASLRSSVANYEAALTYRQSGLRREAISDDVKLLVWARDGGACTRCGSKQSLHFDHIIPFSKGGANSEQNIQLLCQSCNLKKSDKIAF